MFRMFTQLFAAITMLFQSFEKLALASNHLSTWAEESAGAFADEARVLRAAKLNALNSAHRTNLSQSVALPPVEEEVPVTKATPVKRAARKV